MQPLFDLPAIDVHAHYGAYERVAGGLLGEWLSGTAAEVVDRARRCGVALTIVSPLAGLMPRGKADAVAANQAAAGEVAKTTGLGQWVIVHPQQPATFDQARKLLAESHCFGIKLHPEEHQYPIAEHGAALFELAAELDATVLVHSGDPRSWPADFIPWANAHPNVRLILAHLGNGGAAGGSPDLQVKAIQQSRHGNVWVDTSSARSMTPGLIEWAAGEVGADRILFGTDAPLYSTAMQRCRIESADLADADKRKILYHNACRLLGLDQHAYA